MYPLVASAVHSDGQEAPFAVAQHLLLQIDDGSRAFHPVADVPDESRLLRDEHVRVAREAERGRLRERSGEIFRDEIVLEDLGVGGRQEARGDRQENERSA
jgi:hypothetical protein